MKSVTVATQVLVLAILYNSSISIGNTLLPKYLPQSWGKGGKVTSAGWQVTLCDLRYGMWFPVAVW